jgi:hypothetical protein
LTNPGGTGEHEDRREQSQENTMRGTPRLKAHGGIIGVLGAFVLAASWSMAAAVGSDAAFKQFWDAGTPADAVKASAAVVSSGAGFDEAMTRLKAGRSYSVDVPRGVVRLSRQTAAGELFYDLNIPRDYDPQRRYQVRFQLHGGVTGRTTNQPRGDGSIGALAGAEQIYIIPYAWAEAPWWSDTQLDNLRGILDSVKRSYNVDENRVALAGVSDGATATYYFAMRDTTPYASFESLNGFVMVLANASIGADDLFPNNLLNKPFFMVNGGIDPLYPVRGVAPFIEHMKKGGVTIDYRPQMEAAHNTRWWPEVKESFEAFVHDHPRDPLPAKITWQSTGSERTSRAHWLLVDRVKFSNATAPALPDLNRFVRPQPAELPLPPSTVELFHHARPFGRVDVVRTGNVVEATTRDVEEFTLLLSPDAFDFGKPVKVVANGRVVFNGRVVKSVETLMKWAARDSDRTMLFGAELHIKPDAGSVHTSQ